MKFDWKLKKAEAFFESVKTEPENRIPEQIIVILLFFCFIFLIGEAFTSVMRTFIMHTASSGEMSDTAKILIYTYTTVAATAVGIAVCKSMEGRSFRSMGLTKQKLLRDYGIGFLIGFALITAAFLSQACCGVLHTEGSIEPLHLQSVLTGTFLLCGWILQGFSEEFFFRGWLTVSLGTRTTPWKAVVFSSVIFMLVHLLNAGITLIACLNLTLFGVVTALLLLRTERIWASAALHSAWNWAQGNVYGCKVSGISAGTTVLHCVHTDAPAILTGGNFGPEGSILTTVILIPTILLLLLRSEPKKTAHI